MTEDDLPRPRVEVCSYLGGRGLPEKKWKVTLVGAKGQQRIVSGWVEEDSDRAIAKLATQWSDLTDWPVVWIDKLTITMQQISLIEPKG